MRRAETEMWLTLSVRKALLHQVRAVDVLQASDVILFLLIGVIVPGPC